MNTQPQTRQQHEAPDEELVERVRAGEIELFSVLIRRYNQRLFRITRSILKDDAEAEDAMQEAYVAAYTKLAGFRGEAKFSTWLTKIAVHAALARSRRRGRGGDLTVAAHAEESRMAENHTSPERAAFGSELRAVIERALMKLPSGLRAAYMMRDVEGMSTAEAAEALETTEDALKMRLSRARALLRAELLNEADVAAGDLFSFEAPRCDRMVARVMDRIAALR